MTFSTTALLALAPALVGAIVALVYRSQRNDARRDADALRKENERDRRDHLATVADLETDLNRARLTLATRDARVADLEAALAASAENTPAGAARAGALLDGVLSAPGDAGGDPPGVHAADAAGRRRDPAGR